MKDAIHANKNLIGNLDFDFEIVNFPFLDCDVPRATAYVVYLFQLIRFARASAMLLA